MDKKLYVGVTVVRFRVESGTPVPFFTQENWYWDSPGPPEFIAELVSFEEFDAAKGYMTTLQAMLDAEFNGGLRDFSGEDFTQYRATLYL